MGAAGYGELLPNAQALHSDLQKTLADKQHTLVRTLRFPRAHSPPPSGVSPGARQRGPCLPYGPNPSVAVAFLNDITCCSAVGGMRQSPAGTKLKRFSDSPCN